MKFPFAALVALVLALPLARPAAAQTAPPARQAVLPQEEAVHPKNPLEWWYLTGHLKDVDTGQEFGVEYVFFYFTRNGKQEWQMVNFAISDPAQQRFYYDYKYDKLKHTPPTGLPLNLSQRKDDQTWTLGGQEGRYHLQARIVAPAGQALDLTTEPLKPVLLHGGGTGYEQYSPTFRAGYYSYPRLSATGTLEVNGQTHRVSGQMWYDRQWDCTTIVSRAVGWDWLSIQLDQPQEELMLNILRDKKANQQTYNGSFFGAEAQNQHLGAGDFTLEPLTYWTSPASGRRYPQKWRVVVPAQGYDLVVEPLLPQQELGLKILKVFTLWYWEGMCRVSGTHNGQPVTGRAYVEMTNR